MNEIGQQYAITHIPESEVCHNGLCPVSEANFGGWCTAFSHVTRMHKFGRGVG